MLKFEGLIRAIHQAAVSANNALATENVRRLREQYFEPAEGGTPVSNSLDAALASAQDLLGKEGMDGAAVEELIARLQGARDALSGSTSDTGPSTLGTLKPKTLEVLYPALTEDGVVEKKVKVPLIALVPVSLPEISELRLKTPLEVSEDGNTLNVTFPSQSGTTDRDEEETGGNRSTLEIVVRPAAGPEALKSLIEGYEKVLRAQIP